LQDVEAGILEIKEPSDSSLGSLDS